MRQVGSLTPQCGLYRLCLIHSWTSLAASQKPTKQEGLPYQKICPCLTSQIVAETATLSHLFWLWRSLFLYFAALSAYQKYYNTDAYHWQNPAFLYGLGIVYSHFNQHQWYVLWYSASSEHSKQAFSLLKMWTLILRVFNPAACACSNSHLPGDHQGIM